MPLTFIISRGVKTLKGTVNIISKHNLGIILEKYEINTIISFLKTLDSELPKILDKK